MGMSDTVCEALQTIVRRQREDPGPDDHQHEVEVVKAAMDSLLVHLDVMSPQDVDPRSRAIMDRLLEHIKPLVPPEGVWVPIAEPNDLGGQAQEEEMGGRVVERRRRERELAAQGKPWNESEPSATPPSDAPNPRVPDPVLPGEAFRRIEV